MNDFLMMASAQVVETSVHTNNSPSQDYTTNPDDHSNHNMNDFIAHGFELLPRHRRGHGFPSKFCSAKYLQALIMGSNLVLIFFQAGKYLQLLKMKLNREDHFSYPFLTVLHI